MRTAYCNGCFSCHACPPCHAWPPCHAHPLPHTPPSTPHHAGSSLLCTSPTMHAHAIHTPPTHPLPCTPPVNRMTDTCKNITLPQTSFAGGNNKRLPKGLTNYSIFSIVEHVSTNLLISRIKIIMRNTGETSS